ncbi:DUF6364 family protein [Flavobacterium sp. PLA-1-15]|uniref:DUF6364 family protein n=1 Tax=Flavobacterium sp. PLA-1-15 TaxID=3380533 RepID=UPI003B7D93AA
MDAKLTLKFDKQIVEKAKEYASKNNKSLSRIIESYLQLLTSKEKTEDTEEIAISDFVKSLSIKTNVPSDLDYKKEYGDYLNEKYK